MRNNISANDTACKGISIYSKMNSTPEKQTDKKWVEGGLPWWSSGEESACQCRDTGLILVQKDPTGGGAAKPAPHGY